MSQGITDEGSLLGANARGAILDSEPDLSAAEATVRERERRLAELARSEDAGLLDLVSGSTESAVAALETLRDSVVPGPRGARSVAERVRTLLPHLAALTEGEGIVAVGEHDPPALRGGAHPLLDHLTLRVLARRLAGLESGRIDLFQRVPALSPQYFAAESARLRALLAEGLGPCVRLALVHLDFAKGGSAERRRVWSSQLGADLSVHNEAARTILERGLAPDGRQRLLRVFPSLADSPARARLVLALVESHGLAGQTARGETPLSAFAPFVRYLRSESGSLASELGVPAERAAALALECLHAIDVCDTAGVREGLFDDRLAGEIEAVERAVGETARGGADADAAAIETELSSREEAASRSRFPGLEGVDLDRARLCERFARLRSGRQRAGEPPERVEEAVHALSPRGAARLLDGLSRCQLWYAESGTSALAASAQIKVLALGVAAATAGTTRTVHVSLEPLAAALDASKDPAALYRARLLEALLAPVALEDVVAGDAMEALVHERGGASPLGSFHTRIGGSKAVVLSFVESPESAALLTLLPIYERRSSAAFHSTLKTLCDLYGLRKDEFDRAANETAYLAHMNHARRDKARLLDWVRPGRIVEVGPGGGVVLDLLCERFPESDVLGVDSSRMVVEALERRRRAESRRWRIAEADAFELTDLVGAGTVDTVVFCSVLHEIYSYVEYPRQGPGERRRFRLESVRDLLQAAWRALRTGGRIVIRDGVMPPPGIRLLEFKATDAREFFDLFVRQFEGRTIRFEEAGKDRVRLSTADAMEFLYTYVWGPESFPYEVREQYGVLPYEEYRARIREWLGEAETRSPARAVDLPTEAAHYLQDGYGRGLAGRVALFDEGGSPVELPDSNCVMVFEKA